MKYILISKLDIKNIVDVKKVGKLDYRFTFNDIEFTFLGRVEGNTLSLFFYPTDRENDGHYEKGAVTKKHTNLIKFWNTVTYLVVEMLESTKARSICFWTDNDKRIRVYDRLIQSLTDNPNIPFKISFKNSYRAEHPEFGIEGKTWVLYVERKE